MENAKNYLIEKIKALRIENPEATSIFWYSKHQDSISTTSHGNMFFHKEPTFKGEKYTEMKDFEFDGGLSIFDDAVIVGVGSYSDIF